LDRVCNNCGESASEGMRRCPYCGSSFEDNINLKPDSLKSEPLKSISNEEDVDVKQTNDTTLVNSEVKEAYCKSLPQKAAIKTLSNNIKVFITVMCAIIPGIGQLAGVILSIAFINNEEDIDKNSFGHALLIASVIIFFLSCLFWFLIFLALAKSPM
jgi:hypothetical protein